MAGAAPAGGLRVVYGDEATATGASTGTEAPTVLCLIGFGTAPLPREVFAPLAALVGARAAVHTASARLFVFAPENAGDFAQSAPSLALSDDWLGPPGKPGKFAAVLKSTADFLVAQKSIRSAPELDAFQKAINTSYLAQASRA